MVRFGSQLRALREQRGMSVAELARALGINSANLSRIELGARGPLGDAAIKAAAASLHADATPLLEAARADRDERTESTKRLRAAARALYEARVRAERANAIRASALRATG